MIISSLVLAALLSGGMVRAQDPVDPLAPLRPGASRRDEAGYVTAIDAASGRLTVKDERGRTRRFFAKKAKVSTAEGKTISLADLVIGDQVSLRSDGGAVTDVVRVHKALKR